MFATENDRIKRILDLISQMTVGEAEELKIRMAERFHINFPEHIQMQAAKLEDLDKWAHIQVVLTASGPNKIEVLKTIRSIFGYGLKEAKDAVDNPPHQFPFGPHTEEDALEMQRKFFEVGATLTLK